MIGSAAFVGGMSAQENGGNFWQGAAQGGAVAAFNHVAHVGDDDPYENFQKKLKTMDWRPGMPLPAVDGIEPDYSIESFVIGSVALRKSSILLPSSSQLVKFIVKNESWLNKGN